MYEVFDNLNLLMKIHVKKFKKGLHLSKRYQFHFKCSLCKESFLRQLYHFNILSVEQKCFMAKLVNVENLLNGNIDGLILDFDHNCLGKM